MNNLVDYSNDKYHKERHPEFLKSDELSLIWSEFAFQLYFSGINSPMRVLEFGGGLGNNLIIANKYYDCHMIEPSIIGRQFAERFGIKTYFDIPNLKKSIDVKFDKILCRHVLEHLENPLDTLRNLKDLLVDDGELILILPFEKRVNPVKNELDYHLYCWTPRTAYNLLRAAGFNKLTHRFNYFTGKRIFLPAYKIFGFPVYTFMMKLLGIILNAKELQINAKII